MWYLYSEYVVLLASSVLGGRAYKHTSLYVPTRHSVVYVFIITKNAKQCVVTVIAMAVYV